MLFQRVFTLLLVVLTGIPALARETTKIEIVRDVPYSKIGNGKELQMDIAYPDGKGPYPAVLLVHGGAWRFGKRQELKEWMEYLAKDGYVAATISYRLLPDMKFPDAVVDCKTAVRFLRANAEKYHVNKDKIGALGFSAGGYLVCMLGTADKEAGFEGTEYLDQSSRVQAVVDFFGPTDLSAYGNDDSAQNSTFAPMLGARFKEKPELYKKASPISYVGKANSPFLILHGTKDWLVPIEQSRTMCQKLKDAGVAAELIEIEGGGHGFEDADRFKTTQATTRFLAEKLKK